MKLQEFDLTNIQVEDDLSQEEYLKRKKTLDQKAMKYLPKEEFKLVEHNATLEYEPTYIIYQDEIGYEIKMLTPYGIKQKQIDKLRYSGIGNVVDDFTFDTYETSNTNNDNYKAIAKQRALEFVKDPEGKWFTIIGITGSGKTHLCTAICNSLLEKNYSFEYLSWRNQAKNISFNLEEYENFITKMSKADVLYIDDLLKSTGESERVSTFIKDMAGQILDNRYKMKKITIISTEWSQESLDSMDSSIAGRIYEMSARKGFLLDLGTDKKDLKVKKRNYRIYGSSLSSKI